MYRKLFIISALVLLICAACTGKAPTSPEYQYAGNWSGSWKDYVFFNTNTGNPLGSTNFLLVVEKDGKAYGKGKLETYFGGVPCLDQLEIWVEILPDGSAVGKGKWSLFVGGTSFGGEGKVIGQLDAENLKGDGVVIIEFDGIDWHFTWEVTKE